MARETSDREDLLREATALVERVELSLPGELEPVVVGFRRDGSASVFFGADPVYQFNARHEFRRGYRASLLLKAEGGGLVELRRVRTADATNLISRVLASDETAAFRRTMAEHLASLRRALASGQAQLLRQHPPDSPVVERVTQWLNALPQDIHIAQRPNVG